MQRPASSAAAATQRDLHARDIAVESKMLPGSLYYHFKEALLVAWSTAKA